MSSPSEEMSSASPSIEEPRSRTSQVALVLLAGVLLVVVGFLFLRSDGSDEVAEPVPVEAGESDVETSEPEDEADTNPTDNPVETFEVFAPKDPFEPLVSASTGTATGGATVAPGGDATVITNGGGTQITSDGGTPPASGDGGATSGQETIGGRRVSVVDVIGRDGAQIQVDGTVYTVQEGERFAENFELMSTSGSCVTMLYGDDQFTLCEGEEILK